LVIEGYASEAGLQRQSSGPETALVEAAGAAEAFVAAAAVELEALVDRVAQRHTGWLVRWFYELALAAMLAVVLVRPAKNYFYDSWLKTPPEPLLGVDFYLLSAFWLVAWCGVLLWSLTGRLRRGLRREIDRLAEGWNDAKSASGMFRQREEECRQVGEFRRGLERLRQQAAALRERLALPEPQLGHRR
jgi:hypothetical protein